MTQYPAGWTCEHTILQFEAYLSMTLPPGESLATAEHLEACVACAQRLVLYRVSIKRRPRG